MDEEWSVRTYLSGTPVVEFVDKAAEAVFGIPSPANIELVYSSNLTNLSSQKK